MEDKIIKIYVSRGESMEKDIESISKFVDKNSDRMMIYRPEDELEKISARVEKLGDLLKLYKESGINWSVFNRYLRGSGLSQKEIDGVLQGVEAFFRDMGLDKYKRKV